MGPDRVVEIWVVAQARIDNREWTFSKVLHVFDAVDVGVVVGPSPATGKTIIVSTGGCMGIGLAGITATSRACAIMIGSSVG